MALICAAPGPEAPLVRALLGQTDCHVRQLTHGAYGALFPPGGGLATALTVLMTLYVAILGYRLMLGRTAIGVNETALTALKLGIILALSTQWETYQTVVFNLLFEGPQQLAGAIQAAAFEDGAGRLEVLDRLQATFDGLTADAAAYAGHAPAQTSPLMGGAGFGALTLTLSASGLLLSSLGVLAASKIVLGLLLAVGPIFIAMLMFDATRGLFEGWLRASLAFAFAPLAATLLLDLILGLLDPSLAALAETVSRKQFDLAPVYSVAILTAILSAVVVGALAAGGMIAGGFRLPRPSRTPSGEGAGQAMPPVTEGPVLSRADRVAAALATADRQVMVAPGASVTLGRATVRAVSQAVAPPSTGSAGPIRLGQTDRRRTQPREPRLGARSST
jgi:type IV secretion system protein VirB6